MTSLLNPQDGHETSARHSVSHGPSGPGKPGQSNDGIELKSAGGQKMVAIVNP